MIKLDENYIKNLIALKIAINRLKIEIKFWIVLIIRKLKMTIEEKIELAKTSTSTKTLEKLSNDEDDWIRFHVAINKNTSVETLDKLSNDENEDVRSGVAKNENTSIKILAKLSNDENEEVRNCAIKHINYRKK